MNKLCFYHDGLLEDREKYFKLDIITFLANVCQYMQENLIQTITFHHFNKCWKNSEIHFIHQCLLEWESIDDYYNLLYGIILNQLINAPQHLEKVILFYLLYSIHSTQYEKVMISFDLDIMNQLYFFFQDCKEKQNLDVFELFLDLKNSNGLLLSSRVGCKRLSIHPCGLPYIITKRKQKKHYSSKAQLKLITEEQEDDSEKEKRIENTKSLLKASEEYHKAKSKRNVNLISTDPHFAQRCIHTLSNINQKQ